MKVVLSKRRFAPTNQTQSTFWFSRQGNGLGTALLAFQFLFSGFFISYNDIPKGWRWFSALSMFKWPWEAMVRNMLDEEEDRTGPSEVRQEKYIYGKLGVEGGMLGWMTLHTSVGVAVVVVVVGCSA